MLTIGDPATNDCDGVENIFEIPGLLSFLAKGDFSTPVHGVNTLLPEYQEKYGTQLPDDPKYGEHAGEAIDYQPIMIVTYWGFRFMIGFGMIAAGVCVISVGSGWRAHKVLLRGVLGVVGGSSLLLASLHPQLREMVFVHGSLSALGGALMATAHLINRRELGRACN